MSIRVELLKDKKTLFEELNSLNCKLEDLERIKMIIEFLDKEPVIEIVDKLNQEFDKIIGNPAIPRQILIGTLLYCFNDYMDKYSDIARRTRTDEIIKVFTCNTSLSESLFRKFLNESDPEVINDLFVYTLVQFNDSGILKFLHFFLDGSNAISRGSKYTIIRKSDVELLHWLDDNNLTYLRKNKRSLNSRLNKLEKMKEQGEYPPEMIDKVLKRINERPNLFTQEMAKKLLLFDEEFQKRNVDVLCITFPQAVKHKTKHGGWDYGFNLQQVMSDKNIILTTVLLQEANDFNTMDKVLPVLKKTFEKLKDMQKEYGHRRNYKEIESMLEEAILVCDAGYWSQKNIIYLSSTEYKALIMPSSIARYINKRQREQNKKEKEPILTEKEEKEVKEYLKSSKTDWKREYMKYKCKMGRILKYIGFRATTKKEILEQNKGLPLKHRKKEFIFKSENCNGCPLKKKCTHKRVIEMVSLVQFEMINKFTLKKYRKIYAKRFNKSESINGYFKSINGVYHLIGNNPIAINNEVTIKSLLYNLVRLTQLKKTRCDLD